MTFTYTLFQTYQIVAALCVAQRLEVGVYQYIIAMCNLWVQFAS